ncbi:MAG: glycosyltransferase [Eubacteriales bacterium]|nr:glycosyltransferase [Eubacteriales bacterium]
MREDEQISVIVPVYKTERYLRYCIDSILSQTYTNIEVILVEDGSPDECGRICDEYGKLDARIRVIHKKNGGLSSARNAGIDMAAGRYLMFVDSDDFIAADMCRKLYEALIEADAEMSICNFEYVGELTEEMESYHDRQPIKTEVVTGREVLETKLFEKQIWYWTVAFGKLYRKEMFQVLRFPFGKYHEDEFAAFGILKQCRRIACISDACYYYVQHEGSIMRTQAAGRYLDRAEAYLRRSEDYLKVYSNFRCAGAVLEQGVNDLYYAYRCADRDQYPNKERMRKLCVEYRKMFWGVLQHHQISLKRWLIRYADFKTCFMLRYCRELLREKKS